MDGEYEFNPQVLVFFGIFLVLIIAIFFPYQMLEKPKINTTINITPTVTPLIKYVYVTPTPENGIYYAGEYQTGVRKLGRYFSWIRDNVSGYQDMVGHIKAYDYRIFTKVHIYNMATAKYYEQSPELGNKYLFVFVKMYLDEIIGDDTGIWVPDNSHFTVYANGDRYKPINWTTYYRIKEFENTVIENKDYPIWHFGTFVAYSKNLKYASTGGYYTQNITELRAGESNALDGYFVFSIPVNTKESDIRFNADMYSFGSPSWILKV